MPLSPIRQLVALLCLATPAAAEPAKPVKIGSLTATPPAEWKAVKPSNRLRSAQFLLPSGEAGVADAEVNVRPESSPKPEKEFPRWKAEFIPPDGKTLDDSAKESKFEVGGATVYLLDVTGTWKYKEFPQAKKEEERPGYRVIWAIIAEKDTATHVRMSGPAKVIEKYQKGFDGWLKGLK